jgi:hypothetical protein
MTAQLSQTAPSSKEGPKNRLVNIYAFKDTYLLRQMSKPQPAVTGRRYSYFFTNFCTAAFTLSAT